VEKTNLMVFIHPVILRDAALTSQYTNHKYNDLRTLQLGQDKDGVNLMPDHRHPVMPTVEEMTSAPGLPAGPATSVAPAETPAAGEADEPASAVNDSFLGN
jgi:general secretion pathway protein D